MTIYDPTALRRELHEMPELALHEKRTSAYVAEKLKALGIDARECGRINGRCRHHPRHGTGAGFHASRRYGCAPLCH